MHMLSSVNVLKTVRPFNISEYNVSNDVVEKCLSHHFMMRHPGNMISQGIHKTTLMGGPRFQQSTLLVKYNALMNIYAYAVRISFNKKIPRCLIKHVQMGYI